VASVGVGGAHDFSNSFLLDYNGDDTYDGSNYSIGGGNECGTGFCIDWNGTDTYNADSEPSLGLGEMVHLGKWLPFTRVKHMFADADTAEHGRQLAEAVGAWVAALPGGTQIPQRMCKKVIALAKGRDPRVQRLICRALPLVFENLKGQLEGEVASLLATAETDVASAVIRAGRLGHWQVTKANMKACLQLAERHPLILMLVEQNTALLSRSQVRCVLRLLTSGRIHDSRVLPFVARRADAIGQKQVDQIFHAFIDACRGGKRDALDLMYSLDVLGKNLSQEQVQVVESIVKEGASRHLYIAKDLLVRLHAQGRYRHM
jgi:hypothetical protein